jgi:predicted small metal-binding protein
MAKTQPLPLRLGFQGEPNTPESCYQIVMCLGVESCLSVYTGVKVFLLGERLPRTGFKMKLNATDTKVTIKWFAVLSDGSKMRNNKGFVHNAWDVTCSCGWETRTGGAIKASVMRDVISHKIMEHNYTYRVGA